MRNKGKVHPFTSSSLGPNKNDDVFPVLKLLPAAIFTMVSVLSLQDREVLAYMIARSLKTTNPSWFLPDQEEKNTSKVKESCYGNGHGHKAPATDFDCDCFHCYISYWFRWDSSPNREMIHQAIEAFEDHLNNREQSKKSGNGKNKKKDKTGRRKSEISVSDGGVLELPAVESPGNKDNVVPLPTEAADYDMGTATSTAGVQCSRGLARKVLPDLMGIFNSRLWNLWSPSM